MRKMIVLAVAAAGLLAAPLAQAGSDTDRATGGGQVEIGTRGGAGDTIAFTAQGTKETAKGQVQYVDRTATGQTVFHGRVTCMVAEGTTAELAGVWDNDAGSFEILVTDNGEGKLAPEDVIAISTVEDPTCGDQDHDDDNEFDLARGNAQVYDADAP